MTKNINFKAVLIGGIAAGLVSGLVKLGWENILPPRTQERDETNPPQQLLDQLGIPKSVTHKTYRYLDHELPMTSYAIHFTFSIVFATLYAALKQYQPKIAAGGGTVFGLAVWIAFHLVLLPKTKTIPTAKEQPMEEHLSEALGHGIWMWTNDAIATKVYQQLTHRQ